VEFYTYLWRDASGVPFYVGKGKGRRARKTAGRTRDFLNIIEGGSCTVEIVDEFMMESQAHAHEMELIGKYGRREFGGLLINRSDGGEGQVGWVRTKEAIEKTSAATRGRKRRPELVARTAAANRGRKNTAESRLRMAEIHRLLPPPANNKTGYKGVHVVGPGRWRAAINVEGNRRHIGMFATPESAARAYDDAALEAWGVCYLNFPPAANLPTTTALAA
jgi:hypothetical protein